VACDSHTYVGDREAATACYQALADHPSVLVRADAMAALRRVRDANRLYREAAANSDNPAIKTRWARLYLETHQSSDAIALLREALVYDSEYLPAQLGLAAALRQTFEGEARTMLQTITTEHPDNIHALVLLAGIELELRNLTIARGLLNRALELAEEQSVTPLEIYSLHGSANLLDSQSLLEWENKALEIHPEYGDFYATVAHYYIITYRYREAVELYQKAVDLDPTLASAHRDLGVNLLRLNELFGSRYHLAKAFDLDPFDIQTVNTLRLLDSLDGMRLSRVNVADPNDPNVLIGRVLIRLDREDADALEPYVIDLVQRAVQILSKRYDFELQKPMIVELYHDHDDFGVRTVSTPGIGLLGVTFGYLTAMDSPKARASGDFHWGSTLWHEIVHVFTLEASNHLLPRWFSEGLSMYEEWNTGPLPNRELSSDMLSAMREERLLPIRELDSGFVRPTYPGQVQVSYAQAGLICDFISQRWGHEALVTMLKQFADGASTATALGTAIGDAASDFDGQFKTWLEQRYGDLIEALDDYKIAERQLTRAFEGEDWVGVEALARDMIRRYPDRVGSGSPYLALAAAQREQGQSDDALATLLSWHELGGYQVETLRDMAKKLRDADDLEIAGRVLESLNWVYPYAAEEHGWLGDYYLAKGDAPRAIREFNALLGLAPDDPAVAWLGKARAAVLLDDETGARRDVLRALEAAPFFRPAQHMLLELVTGDPVD